MKNIIIIVVGAFLVLTATQIFGQTADGRLTPKGQLPEDFYNIPVILTKKGWVSGTGSTGCDWKGFNFEVQKIDTIPAPATTNIDNSINTIGGGERSITNGVINNTGTLIQWTGDVIVNQCCPEQPVATPIIAPKKEWSANILAGPFLEVLGNKGPLPTGGRVGVFAEMIVGKKEQANPRLDYVIGAEVHLRAKKKVEPVLVSHCDTCGFATPFDPDNKGGLEGNTGFYVGPRVSVEVESFTFFFDTTAKYESGLEKPEDGFSVGVSVQAEYGFGTATSVFVNVAQRYHPSAKEVMQGSISMGGIYRF